MSLLVREVSGPASAKVGESITYRVDAFNLEDFTPEEASQVNWLIKTTDGGVLAHERRMGFELELIVPESWGDEIGLVMPYMRSPTARVAVETEFVAVPRPPARVIGDVRIEAEGRQYYASIDGAPRFYLGTDVRYGSRRGLMNWANAPGPRYRPEDFEADFGDWAWYVLPSARCESRTFFSCLNTYDRARFTFGFLQFAAHTPGDNFVLLLRELLTLPNAGLYFPDLTIVDDRVCRVEGPEPQPLESSSSTGGLMSYFNERSERVDGSEAERAARMVEWCLRDRSARDLQVTLGIQQLRRKLARAADKLQLDGLSDKLCLVVMDILHQGRARYRSIGSALAADEPFDALLSLGSSTYRDRIATLREAIRELESQGRVGRKVYDRASNSFTDPVEA